MKKKYKSKKKEEVVSKRYRRFERGEPARLLALEVAMRHLEDSLDEERVLIGKDEFEERIREEVAQAFKEEELKQAGEMFRRRVGYRINPDREGNRWLKSVNGENKNFYQVVPQEGAVKSVLSTDAAEAPSEPPAPPVVENDRFTGFCFGDDLQENDK